jgi:hypothetical protein
MQLEGGAATAEPPSSFYGVWLNQRRGRRADDGELSVETARKRRVTEHARVMGKLTAAPWPG